MKKFSASIISVFLVLGPLGPLPSVAQDISDELDALEDLPEADLGGDIGGDVDGDTPSAPDSPPDSTTDSTAGAPTDQAPSTLEDDLGGDDLGDDDLSLDDLSDDPDAAPGASTDTPPEDGLPADDAADDLDLLDAETDTGAVEDSNTETPAQALTGAATETAGPALEVVGLDFRQLNDRVRVIVGASGSVDFAKELRNKRRQVIVELRNARITNQQLSRVLDTAEFDGPVALVQAYNSKSGSVPSVKILIQLRRLSDPKITRNNNELYIDFSLSSTEKTVFKGEAEKRVQIPETFVAIDDKMRFTGERISINAKDAELSDVVNLISKSAGRSFVLAGAAQTQKVTLNVQNVPWDQVLAILLVNNKLGYQRLGKVYRIMPVADIQAEVVNLQQLAKQTQTLAPLETRLFPLSYAKAADVQGNVKDFISPERGKVSVEVRTNSLVVTDTGDNLNKIAEYLATVDRQTALIQIEARIVEAKQTFSRSLGVQWKLGEVGSGSDLAGSFVNVGGAGSTLTDSPGSDLNSTGAQGGSRLRIADLGPLGVVQGLLQLAETEEQVKLVSSPRVVVIDNQAATINQGSSRRIQIPGADGVPLQDSLDALLSLSVTPTVTSDGFVTMKADIGRDEPGATSDTKETRKISTQVLVQDGRTAVIGGIYVVKNTEKETGWPLFRSLPIFGTLFRDTSIVNSETNELLIFLSPKILNPDRAFLAFKSNPSSALPDDDELEAELSIEDLNLDSTKKPNADDSLSDAILDGAG